MRKFFLPLIAGLAVLLFAPAAHARMDVSGKLGLVPWGEGTLQHGGIAHTETYPIGGDIGFGFDYHISVRPIDLGLGGEMNFIMLSSHLNSSRIDNHDGTDLHILITPTVKVIYPIGDKMEPYLKLGLGLTIGVPSNPNFDSGAGWNFLLLPGFSYRIMDQIRVFGEFGFVFTGYNTALKNPGDNGKVSPNSILQINAGASYSF